MMEFKIEILSPVHIGCQEKYSGLNYIIDGHKLYYIDPDNVLKCLNGKQGAFVKWLENTIKNRFHLKQFCRENKVPIDFLKQAATYFVQTKERIFDTNDIEKFISQLNMPYIPGTEIKGAIRTAVIYHFFKTDKQILKKLNKLIEEFELKHSNEIDAVKNKTRPNNKIKQHLNKEMGRISKECVKLALLAPGRTDVKYDIFKYLFLSDSKPRQPEDTLGISYAVPFNSTRRFRTYYEYCTPGTVFEFDDLSIEDNRVKREKLEFSEKQKEMVSNIKSIFKCCHEFSHDLLQEEISFFEEHGKTPIASHLRGIAQKNTPDTPVLRIGKDQGYLSLTLGLLFKKNAPDLYERVLIHATKSKSYDSNHGGPLPKTRKIVHFQGNELTSGWVRLLPQGEDAQSKTMPPVNKSHGEKPTSESLRALKEKWSRP